MYNIIGYIIFTGILIPMFYVCYLAGYYKGYDVGFDNCKNIMTEENNRKISDIRFYSSFSNFK